MTSLFAILDHTRSRRGGPNLLFKFDIGILITFGYIAILVFCHFACIMPNHAHFLVNFGGSYPQNLTLIIRPPKGTSLCENASFEPSTTVKIQPGVRPGRVPENKKVNTGVIFDSREHGCHFCHRVHGPCSRAPVHTTRVHGS